MPRWLLHQVFARGVSALHDHLCCLRHSLVPLQRLDLSSNNLNGTAVFVASMDRLVALRLGALEHGHLLSLRVI